MLFGLSETALTAGVAGLLWTLSVSSWVVIVYKTWWIWRALQDVPSLIRELNLVHSLFYYRFSHS